MKKTGLLLILAFVSGLPVINAQLRPAKTGLTAKAANDEALQKLFKERLAEILGLVTASGSDSLAGLRSGLLGAKPEYGIYPVAKRKKLPYTSKEEYTFYARWEYRAEFGTFKPGQEARQQAMEEKISRLVQDHISETNWLPVNTTSQSDPGSKELLHYTIPQGRHHLRVKVWRGSNGHIIMLFLD